MPVLIFRYPADFPGQPARPGYSQDESGGPGRATREFKVSLAADAILPARALSRLAFLLSTIVWIAPSFAAVPSHWQVEKLHRFSGGKNGGNPFGPLFADQNGNLYGTTQTGGPSGFGVIFELSQNNDGSWSDATLHRFQGSDGSYPRPGLTMDAQGNLYGTTFTGGDQGGGVVFELSPDGHGGWNHSVLFNFGGPNSTIGSNPNGNLTLDTNGNVFGTTQLGGTKTCTGEPGPCGVAYELSPSGGGGWTESVLYNFGGPPDGSYPYSPLLSDSAGNLYGTTSLGGSGKCNDGEGLVIGCGTVFELSPTLNGWSETILYNFRKSEQNMPGSPLVFAGDGSLYSTAGYDVFQLKSGRGAWEKSTIYEFTEGIAGTIPSGGVVFDLDGNLYGTTSSSGLDGYSTAFKLSPPSGGTGSWNERPLAHFGKGLDSNQPRGGILIGGHKTLYGAASDTAGHGYVFAVTR
jgi:uncharacterized repeat protein (TIGR03803 family)